MELQFAEQMPEAYFEELLDLLALCDNDFLPPLSSRTGTTQKSFGAAEKTTQKPVAYCKEMMRQPVFWITQNGRLSAFLSFRKNYTCDVISEDTFPNIYLSTLVVHPDFRGQGLAKRLYHAVMEAYSEMRIYTRTWSANASQMSILPKMQFFELKRIENDRGAGIDTVYFCREAQQKGMD